jgi:predicted esterase
MKLNPLWMSALLAVAFGTQGRIQAQEPAPDGFAGQPGQVVHREVPGSTGAAYELYLPSGYATNKPCAVLFAFDPGGSGESILGGYRAACEKAGWVLIGCHKIRNGDVPEADQMAREIIRDVRTHVPHDRSREYVGGFSGGAARSYRFNRIFFNEFAGVLASGGWLGDYDPANFYPSRLAVAMLNGNNDKGANAYAGRDGEILKKCGARVKAWSFEGGHQVGGPIVEAVAWLDEDWKKEGRKVCMDPAKADVALAQAIQLLTTPKKMAAIETLATLAVDASYTEAGARAKEKLIDTFASTNTRKAVQGKFFGKLSAHLGNTYRQMAQVGRSPDNEVLMLLMVASMADPGDYTAPTRLAELLATSSDKSVRDPRVAFTIAEKLTQSPKGGWRSWYARALAERELKRISDARNSARKAHDKTKDPGERELCQKLMKEL